VSRKQKSKLLVVDDEPDNLDLLYRTFRREFQVLKAENGVKALEVLAQEGEVAVIISDQRMPEMKGTEFLSKTVPDFPNTVRIILTGFTDVEDLVEAINSGQVYKYITKPWDPHELKAVVDRAVENYELLKRRKDELDQAQAQTELMTKIVELAQESSSLDGCLEPLARTIGHCFHTDRCILQLVEKGELKATKGVYSGTEGVEINLENDPLVSEAIASGEIKTWEYSRSNESTQAGQYYHGINIQTHLLTPVIYRHETLGLLSLQWQQPVELEEHLKYVSLVTQQVGLMFISYS
jgi:CheY-like chemotaxis protein